MLFPGRGMKHAFTIYTIMGLSTRILPPSPPLGKAPMFSFSYQKWVVLSLVPKSAGRPSAVAKIHWLSGSINIFSPVIFAL